MIYLNTYLYARRAGLNRSLGSDLGRHRSHTLVFLLSFFLIVTPVGTRRWSDDVASALCSRRGGSWDNSTQCLKSEFVTLMCF